MARIHIHLSFEERGGGSPAAQSHELHPPARAFFAYPCPHGDCDGTFDVSAAAHLAVEHASLRSVGRLECTGLRPKGFGAKGPCGLRLAYTIAVVREAGPAR